MPLPIILSGNVASATASTDIVSNSCRFNDNDTAYMHKTPSSSGSQRTFTFSTWWKQGDLASSSVIFSSGESDGDPNFAIYYNSSQQLNVLYYEGSSLLQLVTNAQYRDPSAWYHICVAIDTTQSTNTNRAKIYINGSQVTSLATATYCNQNVDISINTSSYRMAIGAGVGNGDVADGYAAEVVFLDGTAASPTSFGEFDDDTPSVFKPIDVSGLSGSKGTNGFYLDFEDSSNLGNDVWGGTDLTEVNLAAADQSLDTPINNFCTMNSLDNYPLSTQGTFSEGNCIVVTGQGSSSSNGYSHFTGTFGLTAGKWYWEAKCTDTGAASLIGIVDKPADAANASLNAYTYGYAYRHSNGQIYNNGSGASYGDSYGTSDIIGVALDLDNNKLYFSKGGTWQNSGDPTSGSTGTGAKSITAAASTNTGVYFPVVGDTDYSDTSTFQLNFGGCPAFSISSGNADDNGYGNFEYDVPTGYLALCTKNLGSDGG
tara:strand:+ start:140 stop:1597 length:1458 start_codon:yes stop_codon:yes gene_type:complete